MSQYQQPFSFDGLPEIPKDFSADRQRVEDELYNREAGRLTINMLAKMIIFSSKWLIVVSQWDLNSTLN